MWSFCHWPSPSSSSFNFITLRVCSGWPPKQCRTTASLRLVRSLLDHEASRSGSCAQQTEAVKHWPPLGRVVHSSCRPASWVKLCPSSFPPLCPICEITIHQWDLPRKLLGVYMQPPGLGTHRYLKGCWLKDDRQFLLLLQSSPSRKLGWTYSAVVNLTGGKVFHSKIGIHSRLQRTSLWPRQPSLIALFTR